MTIEVPALAEGELQGKTAGESSSAVQARVTAARQAQRMRQGKPNSRLATKEIDKPAPDDAGAQLAGHRAPSTGARHRVGSVHCRSR
ncbi:MAG: hypothetical protein M9884_13410 [Rhodocyclaceae bacterium]|nr:hypothetical protein [Rhodocyclaceae bacterium]